MLQRKVVGKGGSRGIALLFLLPRTLDGVDRQRHAQKFGEKIRTHNFYSVTFFFRENISFMI